MLQDMLTLTLLPSLVPTNPCSLLSVHYDPLQCLQNHALLPQSLQSVKFALIHPLFSSSGPSSPCFIPIISPLQDPTHDHTHNTSSPTGLLQLLPKLLSRYAMQPIFPLTTLTKRAAKPSEIKVTNYQSMRHHKLLQLLSLTMLSKPPTTKLTCSSLTFCYALGVDCDSLSVICSYCGACLRYGCSD